MKPYYKSCDELLKYNFDQIVDTKNFNWLIKGYDGEDLEQDHDLEEAWKVVFDEYIQLKNDENIKEYYRVHAELEGLNEKLEKLKVLIWLYSISYEADTELDIVKHLSSLGYAVNRNKPKKDELDRLTRNKKALLTNINRLKLKNKDLLKTEEKKVKVNREKEVAQIELVLEKNLIDRKKISVSKWLVYKEQALQKIENQRNVRRKS